MAYVKTELISLEWGFKPHSDDLDQLMLNIFNMSLSETGVGMGVLKPHSRLISSVLTSSMAYVKTELISLEWGFKPHSRLISSVLTSSMAYVNRAGKSGMGF